MNKNFVAELKWRGMLQDVMPGTEELLNKETVTAYIGFDPTADSLHVGSLAQIMTLLHFQRCGHKPIALVGGATGMIGDPSGKKEERKLLTIEELKHNESCIKKQLEKFIDFSSVNSAEIVNNNDWFQDMSTILFYRNVGKYLTVNYLLSKGFIKDRISQGQDLSFTEFNYILMQAYDFLWLYENKHCKLQMGGSDQWGNITAGTELIRKKLRGDAYGLTCTLITKADGSKFGKTETGNVWLDPNKTSVLEFKNFWLNASDIDIKTYSRIFSLKSQSEIEEMEREHLKNPEKRLMQKELAKEITIRVHSLEEYEKTEASVGLYSIKNIEEYKSTYKTPEHIEGLATSGVIIINDNIKNIETGVSIVDFLARHADKFGSKSEIRRLITSGAITINFQKVTDVNYKISPKDILEAPYKHILVKKGKKEFKLFQY